MAWQSLKAWRHIDETPLSLLLMNEPNKLVLQYTRLERLERVEHSSLLGLCVGYGENEVL
jgi:hypothetical protein